MRALPSGAPSRGQKSTSDAYGAPQLGQLFGGAFGMSKQQSTRAIVLAARMVVDPWAGADYASMLVTEPKASASAKPLRKAGLDSPEPEVVPPPSRMEAAEFGAEVRISLPAFEGPLDLLLHVIQKHELDIRDIPVGFITEKYLEYLALMRNLAIDVASEYLVMAATLVHIKSKMLLPSVPDDQKGDDSEAEELDPREELVRRLLEYQKYKSAAQDLADRATLGRDVFTRGAGEPVAEGPAPFAPVELFGLLDAFEKVLKRAKVKIEHEVTFDRITITERIVQLTDKLQGRKSMRFEDLLLGSSGDIVSIHRFDLVITFLALLEMCRQRLIRVYQTDPLAPIHLECTIETPNEPGTDEAEGGPS